MKPKTVFFQPLTKVKCESTFTLSASRFSLLWARLHGLVRIKLLTSTKKFVTRHILTGRVANLLSLLSLLVSNKRHVVGMVLLGLGVGSTFAHQLLFDMYAEPHDVCAVLGSQCFNRAAGEGWCYVSWFWYLDTIKYCVAAIFGAVGLILFVPPKYSLSFIPFSILQAFGWTYLIHFTFFTSSHETINAVPHWSIITIGLALGFGVVMSADALLYWVHHKQRGNWQKWPLIFRSPLSQEEKNKLFALADKEYDQVNRMI